MTALKVLVILPILVIGLVSSQCNECLKNKVVCIDEKKYVFCFGNGITSTEIKECEEDSVCTDKEVICLPESQVTPAACPTPAEQGRHCSQCSKSHVNNFACISEEMFVRCNEQGKPDFKLSGSCPGGMVCNIGYEAMCVNTKHYKPSCFNEVTTPPVKPTEITPDITGTPQNPITTLSPSAQCTAHNAAGIYPVGSDCSRYLICSINGGQLIGKEYACPETSYFNKATGKCVISRPQGCPEFTTPVSTTRPPNPSLSPIPSTVTTVNPANQLCADKPNLGTFPFNNSCKQYLACKNINGQLIGNIYSCPDGSFYNQNTARCSTVQQQGCV